MHDLMENVFPGWWDGKVAMGKERESLKELLRMVKKFYRNVSQMLLTFFTNFHGELDMIDS